MSGVEAARFEDRKPPADLQIEGLPAVPTFGGDEGVAQRDQAGLDLLPRPSGPVVGALARGAGLFQPARLDGEPLSPLEERGVLTGVTPDDGSRAQAQARVWLRPLRPAARQAEDSAERALERAWQRLCARYTERR
jgi:hypothetical protein